MSEQSVTVGRVVGTAQGHLGAIADSLDIIAGEIAEGGSAEYARTAILGVLAKVKAAGIQVEALWDIYREEIYGAPKPLPALPAPVLAEVA